MSERSMDKSSPDEELLAKLALHLVPGIGPRIFANLCQAFGSPANLLRISPRQWLEVPGVGVELVRAIEHPDLLRRAHAEWDACRERGIAIVDANDAAFPPLLREIFDPPILLYAAGELPVTDTACVAIVGTRRASHYGRQQAERLAIDLVHAGVTVVSGLARGIDAAAHRATLEAGGCTLGVLAGGLAEIYPHEHFDLANAISHQGGMIAEMPLHTSPRRGHFPRRNRIISGISLGVVVVEAASRSGALVTARHALEQNREVFAVPGHVDHPESHGCHQLIRDGAKLVTCVDDVLEELPSLQEWHRPVRKSVSFTVMQQLEPHEREVLEAIGPSPTSIESLAEICSGDVPRILAALSILEMRQLITRQGGNSVVRR